jgi:hypothetical protein
MGSAKLTLCLCWWSHDVSDLWVCWTFSPDDTSAAAHVKGCEGQNWLIYGKLRKKLFIFNCPLSLPYLLSTQVLHQLRGKTSDILCSTPHWQSVVAYYCGFRLANPIENTENQFFYLNFFYAIQFFCESEWWIWILLFTQSKEYAGRVDKTDTRTEWPKS